MYHHLHYFCDTNLILLETRSPTVIVKNYLLLKFITYSNNIYSICVKCIFNNRKYVAIL